MTPGRVNALVGEEHDPLGDADACRSSSGRSWPFGWFFAMCSSSLESGCRCQKRANAAICSGSALRSPHRFAWLMQTTNVSGSNPDSARSALRSSGGLNRSVGMPCGM